MGEGLSWVLRFAAVAAGLMLVGCTASTKPEEMQSAVRRGPQTLDFVFLDFAIDEGNSPTMSGFNLDGKFTRAGDSGGCGVVDSVSDLDDDQNDHDCNTDCRDDDDDHSGNDGHGDGRHRCNAKPGCKGGVDNRLPQLASAIDGLLRTLGSPNQPPPSLTARFGEESKAGRVITLMRISGVDDLKNDSNVTVALYAGFPADADCSHLFDGGGRFYVSNDSLVSANDLGQPRWSGSGKIVKRRLQVAFGPLNFPTPSVPDGLPLDQLLLRATLQDKGQRAKHGNAGASIPAMALRDQLVAIFPTLRTVINGLLPQLVDMPATRCGGSFGNPVGSLGLGARFDLRRATIVGTASTPSPGACGSVAVAIAGQ